MNNTMNTTAEKNSIIMLELGRNWDNHCT